MAPAMVCLVSLVTIHIAEQGDPWAPLRFGGFAVLLVGFIWLLSLALAASALRKRSVTAVDQVRIVVGMGLVSAALVFAVCAGVGRWLL